MNKDKIYFPNLNGLRFIAAFLVIIHHIEQFKALNHLENYFKQIGFVSVIGKLGVVLFFVLSGYLITYLLLAEEEKFKTISIGKFYMRRVLRIWPLYFLIIGLAFLVFPNIELFVLPDFNKEVIYSNLVQKLILYVFLFPNLVLSLFGVVPYASHAWSIGTEEQFYLVWPILIKYIRKYRIVLMFAIIILYVGIQLFLYHPISNNIPFYKIINAYWSTFPVDCMAIGGIYAVLLYYKSNFLKYLLRNDLFYASIILVSTLMIFGVKFTYFYNEFYSVFFGIIILNFSANNNIKISLENKVFNYLGNISYGLYMFHPVGIMLAIGLLIPLRLNSNWLIYPFSFLFTIALAGLSYKYFETYFLKFKKKFSKVLSGNREVDK